MTEKNEDENPFLPLIGNRDSGKESTSRVQSESFASSTQLTPLRKEPNVSTTARESGVRRTPRGVLSFIKPENLRQYQYDEGLMSQFAEKCRRMTKRQRRRAANSGSPMLIEPTSTRDSKDHADLPSPYEPPLVTRSENIHRDVESQPSATVGSHDIETSFDVWETEFTLFFFGAPYCFHSLQFVPILAKFVHEQNEKFASHLSDDNSNEEESQAMEANATNPNPRRPLQCICVPDAMHQPAIQNFCNGTGMYYFKDPADPGLSSIRSFFQVSYIPTVIVVCNRTGKVVTDWGRTAIEFHPQEAVQAWRNGRSGASYFWSFCTMS